MVYCGSRIFLSHLKEFSVIISTFIESNMFISHRLILEFIAINDYEFQLNGNKSQLTPK